MSALTAALCSCMADTRHLDFISIGSNGWKHTDTLTYTIPPLREIGDCGFSLLLHTDNYPYENVALDVTIRQDTTLLLHKEQNFLLDHNPAKRGIGHRCDYTLFIDNIALCDTLPATVTLVQQLVQDTLMGIREVGIRIGAPLYQSNGPEWRVDWN